MALGVLVLAPALALVPLLPPAASGAVLAVSVAASFGLMLRSERRHLAYLELSPRWVLFWAASLGTGAALSLGLFALIGGP